MCEFDALPYMPREPQGGIEECFAESYADGSPGKGAEDGKRKHDQ
ncbi:MAG: hypothetical protein NVS3B14_03010 [Ktedonobacteraceae bacterium]